MGVSGQRLFIPCLKASGFMLPFACGLLRTPGLLCVSRQVNVAEGSCQKQRETAGSFNRQPHWRSTSAVFLTGPPSAHSLMKAFPVLLVPLRLTRLRHTSGTVVFASCSHICHTLYFSSPRFIVFPHTPSMQSSNVLTYIEGNK